MGQFGAPCVEDGKDGEQDGQYADDPADGAAQGAVDPAEHHEGLIQRSDGLATCLIPANVPPDEETAQGHDKGRNALIANQPAVEGADQCAKRQTDRNGDPRNGPMAQLQTHGAGQEPDLGHRHQRRAGRQNGPHRQVNVAGDDHKDHAGCHDGDADGLDGQVKDVPGRQKPPFGENVEDQSDQDEGTDHAQQPGVEL